MDGTDLFVALLLPFSDGSGEPVVLGIYTNKERAEARCYRAIRRIGYDQPTAIIERPLNFDNEGGDGDPAVEQEHR